MQRLAVAMLILAMLGVLIALGTRATRRAFQSQPNAAHFTGETMPKIAFFLLLCLMAYSILSGAN